MREAGNRQADRQALQGGHVRSPRNDSWARSEQPPLLDEASTHYPKKKGKKGAPKKERCNANPNGHTHEWMKDEEGIPVTEVQWVSGKVPRWNSEEYKIEWIDSLKQKEIQVGFKPVLFKLCVHCNKVLYKRKGWRGQRKWSERPPRNFTRYKSWNGRTVIS